MGRPKRYETTADKQKAYRLRKKGLPFLKEEDKSESTVPGIEMPFPENPTPQPSVESKDEILSKLREMVKQEQENPSVEGSRSHRDVVGGIYRNDFGGVISKSAWEKLQKAKEHAKKNNFVIDEYSQ